MADNTAGGMDNVDIDGTKNVQSNGDQMSHIDMKRKKDCTSDYTKESLSNEDKGVITIEDDVLNDEKVRHKNAGPDDKAPRVGMIFKSYDEVCQFYMQYALEVGFGVAVRKSSFTSSGVCRRLIIACSKGGKGRSDASYQARQTAKTNCQAMIVLKSCGDDLLHLVEAKLEHNHPVSPLMARFFSSYKKMVGAKKEEPVPQGRGHGNPQAYEMQIGNSTSIGQLKLAEGDDDALYQFLARMQTRNPSFFYLVELDTHGRLKNMFWAEARSKASYHYFGDVIYFDTTFLFEKYDLPLVFFTGNNHHGQLVLLGCGLISGDTTETYIWLFRSFLTCMSGSPPNAIITDNCEMIQHAVVEVFPEAQHRLCLSRIMKKIPEKLKGFFEFKEIKKSLKKAVYDSMMIAEFEERWDKMVKDHSLECNEWITSLYENRHSWVPAFLKGTFWAGMSTSQRGETANSFFDGYVYPRTTLKHFLSKYDMITECRYKKDAQADYESFHKIPIIISKFYMEEQLSKLYTVNMFRKFQDELKATIYCDVSPTKVEGSLITFHVRECSYMESGKRTENKDTEVLFDSEKLEAQCICGSFEFSGILCRHALSVFKFQQIYEIPSHHILNRWKKDYKKLHALTHSLEDVQFDNVLERNDYLSLRCLRIAELGFLSDDRYQVAVKLIREVEKALLDNNTCRENQPRLLSFEAQPNEIVQNLLPESTKTPDSLHVKRRGRPPKKGKESNTDAQVQQNKEQDFLRSSLLANENSVLQSAGIPTHLDTHIGTQGGIDLMEDITENHLSFGSHFGMQVNHDQNLGDQPRMQSNNLLQLQGQYEHQAIASQSRMQWIYQQMLQENQLQKPASGRRTG